jgi:hypothetical protein
LKDALQPKGELSVMANQQINARPRKLEAHLFPHEVPSARINLIAKPGCDAGEAAQRAFQLELKAAQAAHYRVIVLRPLAEK